MSTLKTVNIQHPSASTPAITLDSAGAMTGSFPYPNRNLLYNGAMQVHQRGTSTTGITAAGYYTADRWNAQVYTLGTWTNSVENDAPTGSGFRKAFKMLCTTADVSPAAADALAIEYRIEGQDCQRIAKGTASAQQLTLSFWVKANVTGTYIAELNDNDNNRSLSVAYTVGASATWERKTITFAADTTGVLDNDNATSMSLTFWLAAGSDFTSGTLATTWASRTTANRAVGQTNLAAATNNYWQITGVQLETGPIATTFEFKSYGQELAQCQRYYWRSQGGTNWCSYGFGRAQTSTVLNYSISFPQPMRSNPTSIDSSNLAAHHPGIAAYNVTSINISESSNISADGAANVASGLTAGSYYHLSNNGTAGGYIGFSAEL